MASTVDGLFVLLKIDQNTVLPESSETFSKITTQRFCKSRKCQSQFKVFFKHLIFTYLYTYFFRYYCDYCDTYLTHDSVNLLAVFSSFVLTIFLYCFCSHQCEKRIVPVGNTKKMSNSIIRNGWKIKPKALSMPQVRKSMITVFHS